MSILRHKGSHTAAMLGLTNQELLFTIELVKDMNPVRAGQACGIDPDEAMRLSNKKVIKERCEAILVDRLDETGVDIDWMLYELRDNHALARQQGNLTASNKAIELIGKLAPVDAFAANKHQHSGEVGLVVNVKQYSDTVIDGEVIDQAKGNNEALIEGGGAPTAGGGDDVCFL